MLKSIANEARHIASDVHRTAVVNGALDVWDTTGIPDGTYTLRLTVVDIRGNFPCTPFNVHPLIVANRTLLNTPTPTVTTPTETPAPTVGALKPTPLPPPTIVVPTSAARGTVVITSTRPTTTTNTAGSLISPDVLLTVTQGCLIGIAGMALVIALAGLYTSARWVLDHL